MAESRLKKLLLMLLIKRCQLELDELEIYLCIKAQLSLPTWSTDFRSNDIPCFVLLGGIFVCTAFCVPNRSITFNLVY